jgi:hypothetical protein
VRFRFLTAASINMTAFWDVAPCNLVDVDWRFISLIMVAVRTSEKSVYFNETTRHYIPDICHLYLQLSYAVETLPITVAARSRAWVLTACISGSWVWIPINADVCPRLLCCAVLFSHPRSPSNCRKTRFRNLKKIWPSFFKNRRATGEERKLKRYH